MPFFPLVLFHFLLFIVLVPSNLALQQPAVDVEAQIEAKHRQLPALLAKTRTALFDLKLGLNVPAEYRQRDAVGEFIAFWRENYAPYEHDLRTSEQDMAREQRRFRRHHRASPTAAAFFGAVRELRIRLADYAEGKRAAMLERLKNLLRSFCGVTEPDMFFHDFNDAIVNLELELGKAAPDSQAQQQKAIQAFDANELRTDFEHFRDQWHVQHHDHLRNRYGISAGAERYLKAVRAFWHSRKAEGGGMANQLRRTNAAAGLLLGKNPYDANRSMLGAVHALRQAYTNELAAEMEAKFVNADIAKLFELNERDSRQAHIRIVHNQQQNAATGKNGGGGEQNGGNDAAEEEPFLYRTKLTIYNAEDANANVRCEARKLPPFSYGLARQRYHFNMNWRMDCHPEIPSPSPNEAANGGKDVPHIRVLLEYEARVADEAEEAEDSNANNSVEFKSCHSHEFSDEEEEEEGQEEKMKKEKKTPATHHHHEHKYKMYKKVIDLWRQPREQWPVIRAMLRGADDAFIIHTNARTNQVVFTFDDE